MAKRKRNSKYGGLAAKRGFTPKAPYRRETQIIMVDDLWDGYVVTELDQEPTKSPRIKESVYEQIKSEAERLNFPDIHCYLKTVTEFTRNRIHVKERPEGWY